MIKRFYNDSVLKKTALFSLLLLCACALAFLFAPTKAYAAETPGPYKSYDETQGVVITDVNGNVLNGHTSLDINLIQQGVWIYYPMWQGNINTDTPGAYIYTGDSSVPVASRENMGAGASGGHVILGPFHGYYYKYFTFRAFQPNTTYTLVASSYTSNWLGNGPYPELMDDIFYLTTLSFTTTGTRDSSMSFGGEPGDQGTDGTGSEGLGNGETNQNADTEQNPQTGSSSNSTQNSQSSSDLAPNAFPTDSTYSSASTMTTSSNGSSGDLSAMGSNSSSGSGSDLTTVLAGRSSGASNISGETLASLGNVYKMGEESTTTVLEEEATEEATAIALSFILNNLPYLYMLFMGILIAALPLGLLKRVLATRFKQGAATRIA